MKYFVCADIHGFDINNSNPKIIICRYQYKIYEPNKAIICGHWHCSALWHAQNPEQYEEFGPKKNFEPFIIKEMIALDSCTAYTKKVNCILIKEN